MQNFDEFALLLNLGCIRLRTVSLGAKLDDPGPHLPTGPRGPMTLVKKLIPVLFLRADS
jgi:hypothetical protein